MTASAVPSPCVSVCRMDEATGWCIGCLRTLDEIAVWTLLGDDEKRALLSELGGRRVHGLLLERATAGREAGEAD